MHFIRGREQAPLSITVKMKTYVINTCPLRHFPFITKQLKQIGELSARIHIGIDVELQGVAVAIKINGQNAYYLGKISREHLCALTKRFIELGHEVHCVQEACGFGPYLHRDLQALGAGSKIIAPQKLSEKRKTDKADAKALAQKLWDFTQNKDQSVFKVVKDLSEVKRIRRAKSRQVEQLQKARNMLSGNGRGLMYEFGFYEVADSWWGARKWIKLRAKLSEHSEFLLESVTKMQESIQQLHQQIVALQNEVQEEREQAVIPKGLGLWSFSVIENEVADW